MRYFNFLFFLLVLPVWAEDEFAEADGSSAWLYLNESSRKAYQLRDHEDLVDPGKDLRKEKIKMRFFYLGESTDHIDDVFAGDLPADRYMYLKLYSNTESIDVEDIPIVISRRSRKKLIERMVFLEEGTEIVLYGSLRKVKIPRELKSKNKNLAKKDLYCFMVTDAYLGYLEELKFSGSSVETDRVVNLDSRYIDLKIKQVLGRKISFTASYLKRKSEIGWQFKQAPALYSNRKYLQILCKEASLKNCYLLVNRKSEKNLEVLQEINQGDKISITAEVKPSPGGRTDRGDEYILLIDTILPPEKTQLRRNDVPEYDDDAWEY